MKAIRMASNSKKPMAKNVFLYVKLIVKFNHFVDLPCYIDSNVLKKVRKNLSISRAFVKRNYGMLQILSPTIMSVEPEDTDKYMSQAIKENDLDLIKIIAPPNTDCLNLEFLIHALDLFKTKWNIKEEIMEFLLSMCKPELPEDLREVASILYKLKVCNGI